MNILDITDAIATELNMSLASRDYDSDWKYHRALEGTMLMGINTDSWTLRFYEQAGFFPFLEIDLSGDRAAYVLKQIPYTIAKALAAADRTLNGAICASVSQAVDAELSGTPAAIEGQRDFQRYSGSLLSAIVDVQTEQAPAIASLFALWQRTAERLDALQRDVANHLERALIDHETAAAFGWDDRKADAWKEVTAAAQLVNV